MRNPYRQKRLLDIAPDVFLEKLTRGVTSRLVDHSDLVIDINPTIRHWQGRVMKKDVNITLTDTSFVIMVHTPEDDTVNGIFSCATFIDDGDTSAVFVLDNRRACVLTGMIQEVFENLLDEYTSKYPGKSNHKKGD